ncbi:MAG: hypothetical protein LBB81_11030 [Treponema sp.]|nr:hypothetical protein [Treponema sp.]
MGGELFYICYDGKAIGAYIGDAIRNITGQFDIGNNSDDDTFGQGAFTIDDGQGYGGGLYPGWSKWKLFCFDASRVVPVSHENRPVSISALFCISY